MGNFRSVSRAEEGWRDTEAFHSWHVPGNSFLLLQPSYRDKRRASDPIYCHDNGQSYARKDSSLEIPYDIKLIASQLNSHPALNKPVKENRFINAQYETTLYLVWGRQTREGKQNSMEEGRPISANKNDYIDPQWSVPQWK